MIVGIDATNIRNGGGVNHLVALLGEFKKQKKSNDKFIIWSNKRTLSKIKKDDAFIKIHSFLFEKNFLFHIFWRIFYLPKEIRVSKCDLLFVPGGSYSGKFKPVVSMCRNMLPFDHYEKKRYFPSFQYYKFHLLSYIQYDTFKKSQGVIFLNNYARNVVYKDNPKLLKNSQIIPHGINDDFFIKSRLHRRFDEFSAQNPVRLIYVSSIDYYKHQDQVVLAVKKLRKMNIPASLTLIGSAYSPALNKLRKIIKKIDPHKSFIKYYDFLEHDKLVKFYKEADIALFASTCENLPNILLEYLASKLPIACSNKQPMLDILNSNAEFFDSENSESIAEALENLIKSFEKREKFSNNAHNLVINYTWENTAAMTLNYFRRIIG